MLKVGSKMSLDFLTSKTKREYIRGGSKVLSFGSQDLVALLKFIGSLKELLFL
jgi:hypothetical protein